MTVFDQKKKILEIFSLFFYEKKNHIYLKPFYLKPFLRDIIISILLPYY